MGRKNRDNRMGQLGNQWDTGRGAVKPDRVRKYKAGKCEKAKGNEDLRGILAEFRRSEAVGWVERSDTHQKPAAPVMR
jgi:hypothetical protein